MADIEQRQTQDAWVNRVLGIDPGGSVSDASPSEAVAASGAPRNGAGKMAAFQKARSEWLDARDEVAHELDDLMEAMRETIETDETEGVLTEAGDIFGDIVGKFDQRLVKTLDKVMAASDDQARAPLIMKARAIVADYGATLAADPNIGKLEGATPFGITLSVQSRLTEALRTIGTLLG